MVSASVRGIGVAVITSTSGETPFCCSAFLCRTPKRCCSSMMARPSLWNSTSCFEQRMRADRDLGVSGRERALDESLFLLASSNP
jgi:hypothetical protein